jgi:hypothetical protein
MTQPTPEPSEPLTSEAKALSKHLGSHKAQVRNQAVQQIQNMGTAGRDVLVSIMRQEEQQRKSLRKQQYKIDAGILLFFVVAALCVYHIDDRWTGIYVLAGSTTFVLSRVMVRSRRVNRTHTTAAYLLAKHFEDVSIVGPLAEALEYRSKRVREAATAALIRLLPRLQTTDSDLLNSEQRDSLHRALMGNSPELVLAVLGALDQVGDSRAIPNVEVLAAGLGVAAGDRRIRDMAQQTLLVLRQRVELQRAPQTLLRAATSEGGDLLRTATGGGDPEATVLLRATSEQ